MTKVEIYEEQIMFYKEEVEQYKNYTRMLKFICIGAVFLLILIGMTASQNAFTVAIAVIPMVVGWYSAACLTALSMREQRLFDLEFEKKLLQAVNE